MSGQWRKIKQLRGHLEDLSTLFTVVHSSVLTIQIQIQVRKLQRQILKHKYKIKQLNDQLEDLSALFTVDHSSVLTTQIQIQKLQIQIQKIQIPKQKHKYKIKQLGDGGRLEDLSALFTVDQWTIRMFSQYKYKYKKYKYKYKYKNKNTK